MPYYSNELYHHGVKGMKWGVRRYQNKDGTRTALGRRLDAMKNGTEKTYNNAKKKVKKSYNSTKKKISEIKASPEYKKATSTAKKVLIGAAIAAAVAGTAYAGYKLYNSPTVNKKLGDRAYNKMVRSRNKEAEYARLSRGYRSGMQYSNSGDTIMRMNKKADDSAIMSKLYRKDRTKYAKKAKNYYGRYLKNYKYKSTKTFSTEPYKIIRR